jgi:hypothetical protein
MGPYYAYQAFEASRGKSSADLREADAQLGRLAQSAAGLISHDGADPDPRQPSPTRE